MKTQKNINLKVKKLKFFKSAFETQNFLKIAFQTQFFSGPHSKKQSFMCY